MLAEHILGMLGHSPFFADFDRDDVKALSGYMEVYRAEPGTIILREGDQGDTMLLLLQGKVDVLKKDRHGIQQRMTSILPGMTLGEMSLIDGEPRFATCRAAELTTYAVLTRDSMVNIILEHPSLASKLLVKLVTLLSQRLRYTTGKLLEYMEK
ncbi:MAG: cyclic nucleotide-binding domain-containing protein [Pseudomonadota bacterium]